ncbi:MAG: hypothetical protein QM820_22800 [Minicystis sp.]
MTRTSVGAILALALAAAGCKREAVTYSLSISTASLPRSAPYRVLFRGADLPLTGEGTTRAVTFTAGAERWFSDDVEALGVEIETPCGPSVVHAWSLLGTDAKGWSQRLREQEKKFRPGSSPVSLGTWTVEMTGGVALVHVDRREAAGKEVTIGKQVLRPGAGVPLRPYSTPRPDLTGDLYEIAAPTCPDGKQVRVGGESVGEVGTPGNHVHTLVDMKGGHCYEQVSVSYSTMPRVNLPFMRPQSKRLSGSRVYVFTDGPAAEETDMLLAGCPSRMSARSSCTYILPVTCAEPTP